jgi:acyl-CoA thioester hydrolase
MYLNFKQSTKLRVRYGETDQMGYCYYGNYAQYFEVGRVEALRAVGMSYRKLEESGIMLPVSEFHVNYLLPAKYDDELEIITTITSISGARIVFEYAIMNEDGKLISTAKTTLVFVTKNNMRPTSAPKEFIELLTPYKTEHD